MRGTALDSMNLTTQRDSSPEVFRLAAKLEMYDSHLEATATGRDPATWRRATQQLKEMVAMWHGLPQFAVEIMDIARQHLRLLAAVASGAGAAPPEDVRQLCATVDLLREKCLGLVRQ